MSRADRRRAARTRPAAAAARYQSARVGTEQLFFQRLRRQAKWMFVLLALVFGVGFVIFGVGSDVPGGVADILGGGSGGGQPSVEKAQEKVAKNPSNAAALRELATALQADGRPEEAIGPLQEYTAIRRQDEDAFRELAGLYLTQATRLEQEAQLAQLEVQAVSPGTEFLPPPTTDFGKELSAGPVVEAVSSGANERLENALGELRNAFQRAKITYQAIVRLNPDEATDQFQLATTALNSGDNETALKALKSFVALAPDDPNADAVREQIKRLELLTKQTGVSPRAASG